MFRVEPILAEVDQNETFRVESSVRVPLKAADASHVGHDAVQKSVDTR